MTPDLFLGKPTEFWMEMLNDVKLRGAKVEELYDEIIKLRGKISFYESHIKIMHDISNK